MKDRDGFIRELEALTVKYGIQISGCGCCGSPRLDDTEAKTGRYTHEDGDYLTFLEA